MDKTKTYLKFSISKFYLDNKKTIFHDLVEEKSKNNNIIIDSYTVCGIKGKFNTIDSNSQYVRCKFCELVIKEYNKI